MVAQTINREPAGCLRGESTEKDAKHTVMSLNINLHSQRAMFKLLLYKTLNFNSTKRHPESPPRVATSSASPPLLLLLLSYLSPTLRTNVVASGSQVHR